MSEISSIVDLISEGKDPFEIHNTAFRETIKNVLKSRKSPKGGGSVRQKHTHTTKN